MYKILLLLLLILSRSVLAAIVDETRNVPDDSTNITDREMLRGMNLQAIQTAFDNSKPTDNIRAVPFDKNRIYKLRLREMMSTLLVLPKGEKIASYTLGDQTNFTFIPAKSDKYQLDNIANIYGKYPGADTDLTIVGVSGNIYSFYLRIDSIKSKFMPDFVFYITDKSLFIKNGKIKEKLANLDQVLDKKTADYLRELPNVDVSKIDFNYKTVSGDTALAPIRVFDDGYWTYFQFSKSAHIDEPRRLPVVYRVVDGYDTPVNTRIEGGMLIAETVSKGWTLRAGKAHLCIRQVKQ